LYPIRQKVHAQIREQNVKMDIITSFFVFF